MFDRQSRYRDVPDVTVPDARGRMVLAKDVRVTPPVTGTFRHVVTAGDRLDQLAWQYYGRPLQFWRICDANPEFLSPLALVDQETIGTVRVPVAVSGDPPWAVLLAKLTATAGVDGVLVDDDTRLARRPRTVDGREVTVTVAEPDRAVVITFHRASVGVAALIEVIRAAGFTAGAPADAGQVGQPIVVPVAAGG
ncbi:tail protein X [Micromonospora rhizosphaerae]|uniref:tail protein X n=1 Tax=Micromonospora rhizosphaerae TaxID=568872 RepID=UPI001C4043B6|nr:tail protein X [Micromonospora rhizosphaerae]